MILISTFLESCTLSGGTSHPLPLKWKHIKYTVLLGALLMRPQIWSCTVLESLDFFLCSGMQEWQEDQEDSSSLILILDYRGKFRVELQLLWGKTEGETWGFGEKEHPLFFPPNEYNGVPIHFSSNLWVVSCTAEHKTGCAVFFISLYTTLSKFLPCHSRFGNKSKRQTPCR